MKGRPDEVAASFRRSNAPIFGAQAATAVTVVAIGGVTFIKTLPPRKRPNQRKHYPRGLQATVAFAPVRGFSHQATPSTVFYAVGGETPRSLLWQKAYYSVNIM
ncbi:hypothetical protein BJX62DRAFT_236310 [Aspergillus germanicus]